MTELADAGVKWPVSNRHEARQGRPLSR
jgi:hypothetical protein